MRMKSLLSAFFVVIVAIAIIFSVGGCASIVPPLGGPRDSLPPVIIEVDPPNQSTNFNSNRITIKFDEYVELENYFENMIVSPLPKVFPDVKRKLKTIEIKLKDTLEKNTTYALNFENAIKDVNEGNKAKEIGRAHV